MQSTLHKPIAPTHAQPTVAGVRIIIPATARAGFLDLRSLATGETWTVGRAERRDITIHDDSISRMHCHIERRDGDRLVIVDRGSRNGIQVARLGQKRGSMRRPEVELQLGRSVHLGDVVLVPVDADARAPIVAYRLSEFVRAAGRLYGPGSILQRMAGFGHSIMSLFGRRPQGR